jgi:subtilisin family serine protease
MELFTFNSFYQAGQGAVPSFGYNNPCNSITIPADGDSAITVGATFWNEDSTSPLYGLETFSGLGPRNAAGGSDPGTQVNKPDVVAPDGVSGATYGASNGTNYANGGSGFWGTSAASPHTAGLAATAWSGVPSYSLAQLRSFIQSIAVYKGDGGACGGGGAGTLNNRYGWGRIDLSLTPTAVTLSTFNANIESRDAPGRIRLTWTSASEINTAGFNVYRGELPEGPYTRINPQLIPAGPDALTGQTYQYVDTDAAPGRQYYYQLEDVALDGTRTRHEPITITGAAVSQESAHPEVMIGLGVAVALLLARFVFRARS